MLIVDNSKKVSLYSTYFDKMREDLDTAILKAIAAMNTKDVDSGSVSLKIDFSIIKVAVFDKFKSATRRAIYPDINYKVTLTVQSKGEAKGDITNKNHELVMDENGEYFIVTKGEADGQLNMFDSSGEVINVDSYNSPGGDAVDDLDPVEEDE